MTIDAEMLRYLSHSACNRVDKLIELLPVDANDADWREVHGAINRVRAHLEARACQAAVPMIQPTERPSGEVSFEGLCLIDPALFGGETPSPPGSESAASYPIPDAELNALLGL